MLVYRSVTWNNAKTQKLLVCSTCFLLVRLRKLFQVFWPLQFSGDSYLPHETSLQDPREKARVDDRRPANGCSFVEKMLRHPPLNGQVTSSFGRQNGSGHPNGKDSTGRFLLSFESGCFEVSPHPIGLFGLLYTRHEPKVREMLPTHKKKLLSHGKDQQKSHEN